MEMSREGAAGGPGPPGPGRRWMEMLANVQHDHSKQSEHRVSVYTSGLSVCIKPTISLSY